MRTDRHVQGIFGLEVLRGLRYPDAQKATRCSPAQLSGRCRTMREGATMKKLLPWIIAAALLLAFVLYIASMFHLGTGSRIFARIWRRQLLACQSLDEVKQHFNCIGTEGSSTVEPTKPKLGRPWALIKSFPDGRWIACAYADRHGAWGGGTIITRDSSGEIHIFFCHVCGQLYAKGETLEEFYTSLRGYEFRPKEVFLK